MDPMQNQALLIFSALSPLLIALIKQSGFSTRTNALIALAVYVLVGIGGALLAGEPPTIENAVSFITVATVVGTVAYQLFWRNMGERELVEATSFIKEDEAMEVSDGL